MDYYTVHELGELAGVSARTIRYYDQIGLLKPAKLNPSGYRIYGPAEVDRLQQILFYRELGVSLKKIKEILNSPGFDRERALREHRENNYWPGGRSWICSSPMLKKR